MQGSAKRLVKAALQEAARKREMRYSDLQKIEKKCFGALIHHPLAYSCCLIMDSTQKPSWRIKTRIKATELH
ncbi:hypothetical protein OIU77_012161 [Salix suchowensis]|uniref:Uncharacterized protein n=1 Tax=Salix suchowensis TaxID=1278906 RepID=A0ABQ9A2P2_9ROSI|nr:hypothetical protein OIU77_012161 [Salix suchowensis]